jgi:hypothetical protein
MTGLPELHGESVKLEIYCRGLCAHPMRVDWLEEPLNLTLWYIDAMSRKISVNFQVVWDLLISYWIQYKNTQGSLNCNHQQAHFSHGWNQGKERHSPHVPMPLCNPQNKPVMNHTSSNQQCVKYRNKRCNTINVNHPRHLWGTKCYKDINQQTLNQTTYTNDMSDITPTGHKQNDHLLRDTMKTREMRAAMC